LSPSISAWTGAIVTGIRLRPGGHQRLDELGKHQPCVAGSVDRQDHGVGLVANAHLQERAALRLRSDDRLDSPPDAGASDESQLRPRRTGARVDQRGTTEVGHFRETLSEFAGTQRAGDRSLGRHR
jgi:hypothetical protein